MVANVKGKKKRSALEWASVPIGKRLMWSLPKARKSIPGRGVTEGLNMAIVKQKPTSPGRRFVIKVSTPDLYKGEPYRPLLEGQGHSGGRKLPAYNQPSSRGWA